MRDKAQTYYHWVETEKGKFYLGYDFYLGYETLYDQERKNLASKFYAPSSFDKKDWIVQKEILREGVEKVLQ